jgi:2'-5' RNA ligase
MPTFIKWWEQTVSDRVLPATTELEFTDENDVRDQKQRAEVQKMRADTRAVQIQSGEISPAMSRQLAVDSEDLPREFIADDATAGGQISDDEKMGPETQSINPAILSLIQSAPTTPPKQQGQPGVATKAAGHTGVMIALFPDVRAARAIAGQAGVTEPVEDLHLTLAFMGDSSEFPQSNDKARVVEAVKQWAIEQGKPLKGAINGLGRFFNAESDDTNAVYVSPDVPGLPELRQSLCDWIEASGFDYAQNHGFTPHMTVAYVPVDAPTPAIRVETPVTFDKVTLAWGDEHIEFPLGTAVAMKDTAVADIIDRYKALSTEATALGLEPVAWTVKDAADDLFESELGWAKRLGKEARKRG